MSFEPYVPDIPPEEYDQGYLLEEFQKISEKLVMVLEAIAKEYHAPPDKPYNGQRVLADGVDWNPGAGRGIYWYDANAGTWNKL